MHTSSRQITKQTASFGGRYHSDRHRMKLFRANADARSVLLRGIAAADPTKVVHDVFAGCTFSTACFVHVHTMLSTRVPALSGMAHTLRCQCLAAASWLDRFQAAGLRGMTLSHEQAREVDCLRASLADGTRGYHEALTCVAHLQTTRRPP